MNRNTLLLRYAELESAKARGETSDSAEAEIQTILIELDLTRDHAIEEAKQVVVGNYDNTSK